MKRFYSGLKAVYGPKVGSVPVWSADGSKLICDKRQILQRWVDHFETVLNQPSDFDDTVLDEIPLWPPATYMDDPPTMQEVNKAVYQLASDKAPGADCIPAEVFKEGGIKLKERLLRLYNNIWEAGEVPQDFKDALIVHILYINGKVTELPVTATVVFHVYP